MFVIMPEGMSVREAHDVAESLEKRIEKKCGEVDRAFVHIDHEW
jgi:divalent metal cation (Fe/Co/Zn/Cd) transporter